MGVEVLIYILLVDFVTQIESIPYVGTIDYKILKHQGHHLFQSQLKHPVKFHKEHPKAQQLLLLSMESG